MESRTLRSALTAALVTLAFIGAGCGKPVDQSPAPSPTAESTQEDGAPGIAIGEPNPSAPVEATSGMPVPGSDVEERQVIDDNKDVAEKTEPAEAAPATVRTIKVTASSWQFNPAEIRTKVGERIRLEVTSVDVDHGFAIPALGINIKLAPGTTGSAEFAADKAGSYTFFCNVFCGSGHQEMRGTLIVE